MSPTGELSTSDTGPTALPKTHSITPLFPASFDSDTIPDPLLLEMELAREELAANEQTIDGSRRMTISFEEALQREMEYQKRVKAIMSQHQVEKMSLPTAFQELPPKASPVGIKRKLLNIELVPSSGGMHHSTLPPEQLQDGQDVPHILKYREPSPKQLQDQQFSVRQSLHQHSKVKPEQQQLHGRQPLPHQSLDDQPSSFQELRTRPAEHLQCQQPLQNKRTPPVQHLKQQNPVPNNRPPPPQQQQSQNWRLPLHRQPQRQPLLPQKQQSQDTPPLHHQSQGQSLPPQQQQLQDFASPLIRRPQGVPNYQENPVWCNLCKIKCVTHFNLKMHCQGKKHRVKHFEVFGRKMGSSSF